MTPYKLPHEDQFEHQISDKPIHLIRLENNRGMAVALSDYGARIVSIIVPDKQGNPTDVVLGFDSIQGYLAADELYHGVTVGRFANRIANGRFTIDGETFHIQPNNGPNALHGGAGGLHCRVWDRRVVYKEKPIFNTLRPMARKASRAGCP